MSSGKTSSQAAKSSLKKSSLKSVPPKKKGKKKHVSDLSAGGAKAGKEQERHLASYQFDCDIEIKKEEEEFMKQDVEIIVKQEEENYKPSLDPCDYEVLKPHCCSVCQKCFKTAGDLKKHFRIHTGERPYKCSICSKSFTFAGNLKKHRTVHSDERPFQCHLCQKSYKIRNHLNAHLIIHSGIKAYHCGICNKDFVHLWSWHCHMSNHNGVYKYQCPVCKKGYNGSSDYKRHLFIHGGEKPLKCEFCDQRYSHSSALKRHINVHHTVRNLKCNRCEKVFEFLEDFKKHKLTHKGEKHLKCEICSKAFGKLSHLKRHYNVHKNKPLLCSICKQSFRTKNQLLSHTETHINILEETNDKPVGNDMTDSRNGEAFNDSDKSGTLKCAVCGKTYKNEKELSFHMQVHDNAGNTVHAVTASNASHSVSSATVIFEDDDVVDSEYIVDDEREENDELYGSMSEDEDEDGDVGSDVYYRYNGIESIDELKNKGDEERIKCEEMDDEVDERNYMNGGEGELVMFLPTAANESGSKADGNIIAEEDDLVKDKDCVALIQEGHAWIDEDVSNTIAEGCPEDEDVSTTLGSECPEEDDGISYEMVPLCSTSDYQSKKFKTKAEIIDNNDDANFVNVLISIDPEEDEDYSKALDPGDGIFFAEKVHDTTLIKAKQLDQNFISEPHMEIFETDVLGIEDEVNEVVLNTGIVLDTCSGNTI